MTAEATSLALGLMKHLFLAMAMMTAQPSQGAVIDLDRFAYGQQANELMLRQRREIGDLSSVVRPIDVLFYGTELNIKQVAAELFSRGWRINSVNASEEGKWSLSAERDQAVDADAIRDLTIVALEMEKSWGVEFDGWGAVIVTGTEVPAP
mgnify:CR=1 FL=1